MKNIAEARHLPGRLAVCALVLAAALASPTTASADLATDIHADLAHPASAVPQPVVTVAPPTGEATAMGLGDNVSVKLTLPASPALSGILVPPGTAPVWTPALGKKVLYDLAVLEAVKHALARGAQIDSLTLTHFDPTHPDTAAPDLVMDIEPYESPPQAPVSMSPDDVRQTVRSALPQWAAAADLSVRDDAVGERVVSVRLTAPPAAFRVVDGDQILQPLIEQQQVLASLGANIGRVTVEISDPATGHPLYVGGADSMFGFATAWYSPLVQALVAAHPVVSDETGNEEIDSAISDVKTTVNDAAP